MKRISCHDSVISGFDSEHQEKADCDHPIFPTLYAEARDKQYSIAEDETAGHLVCGKREAGTGPGADE